MKHVNDVNSWSWFGYLTVENCEAVANTILQMLSGKWYSFAATGVNRAPRIDLRTHQQLKNGNNKSPLSYWSDVLDDGRLMAGFNFGDTYGVWGASTTHQTQQDAYDNHKWATYIVFEYEYKIEIYQRAGSGEELGWTIVIENSDCD